MMLKKGKGLRDVWFAPEKLPALTDRLTGAEVQLHIIGTPFHPRPC